MFDRKFKVVLEYTYEETYSKLVCFVRDVDLPEEIAEKYKPLDIIREPELTEACVRVGGMVKSHRYAIFSNHMKVRPKEYNGPDWGICSAKKGSRFQVIDVYHYKGKTQIALLHLLDEPGWEFLNAETFGMPKDLISETRKIFEERLDEEPIADITNEEWFDRCKKPIGIDENGELISPYDRD